MTEPLPPLSKAASGPLDSVAGGRAFHAALYIGSLSMGGAERVMANLAEALYSRGWRVTLVTTYLAEEEYELPHALWRRPEPDPGPAEDGGTSRAADPSHGLRSSGAAGEGAEGVTDLSMTEQLPEAAARGAGECAKRCGPGAADPSMTERSSLCSVWTPEERPTQVRLLDGEGIARRFSGVASAEAGGRLTGFRRRCAKLRSIWGELRPDVILSFLGKNNLMALATAGEIPVVVSVRAMPELEYPGFWMRRAANLLFPRASAVVLQTEGAGSFFSGRVRERAVVIPNMVSEEFLTEGPPEGSAVELGNGASVPRDRMVVAVGRMDANKRFDLLLRAFAAIAGDQAINKYQLLLYGDGEERPALERLAESLGIGGRVAFQGRRKGIAALIRGAACYCLMSDTEGMPNTLLEAMCLGIPSVTTDCVPGGIGQLVTDGVDALVVPAGDEAAFAAAMRSILTDRMLAKRLGDSARRMRERCAPERVAEAWEAVLRRHVRDRGFLQST